MQLNRIKRYEFAAPGGGVSSVNGMTGDVVIGDVGGLTCFVNALGGNDYTAQPGNYLRPFQTLHGAVYAVQPGGAIEVFAGEYNETDATLPLGLLLHSYDFYFHPNTTVNYFGNYGLYISESWKSGNIYGYGKFNAYAPSFTNPYGAAFYIEIANTQKLFEFVFIIAAYDSSDSDNKAVRIGGCTSTGTNWTFSNRILSRRSVALTLDEGSRSTFIPTTGFIQSTGNQPTVVINNPVQVQFTNTQITGYGSSFGRNQPKLMTIFLNHNTQKMSFQNCPIHLVTSNSNYRLIDFQSPVYPEYGVTFKECSLINSSESSTAPSGNSLYSDYALQVRILDTYASAAKGGSGTLTNLITQGNKLMIDPQLKL